MTGLAELRAYWDGERPRYESFARYVHDRVAEGLRQIGIPCEMACRAKTLDSLLKKAIRKNYANPIDEITDKAGVRVVLLYQDHRADVVSLIRSMFDLVTLEDAQERLGEAEFGYQGIHCQVRLKLEEIDEAVTNFTGFNCEIQIHTCAQHAWSETTHDLIYKPIVQVPLDVKRASIRLQALTELFDNEISRVRQQIMTMPDYKDAQVFTRLERAFYRLTHAGRVDVDMELSIQVINYLMPVYADSTSDQIAIELEGFVGDRREKLEYIYMCYQNDHRIESLFIHQPESLMIFHLLERDSFALVERWQEAYDRVFLEQMALLWGRSLE